MVAKSKGLSIYGGCNFTEVVRRLEEGLGFFRAANFDRCLLACKRLGGGESDDFDIEFLVKIFLSL